MTHATYNTDNTLTELPGMEEPNPDDRPRGDNAVWDTDEWRQKWTTYRTHLATLRTLPCSPECRGKWAAGQKLEEGRDYEVRLHYHAPDDKELTAFPITGMTTNDWKKVSDDTEDGWLTTKPVFAEECILITASKVRDKWNYNFWLIEKLDDMEDNWYWGILCPDGDEWGDLDDLEAEKYLVIPKLKYPCK